MARGAGRKGHVCKRQMMSPRSCVNGLPRRSAILQQGHTKALFVDTMELPGWCIDYDRAATIAGYAQIPVGGPEKCTCDACRNWALTRDAILPNDMRALLERLGVACGKECEVYHVCRLESGLHSYGGWYHFVGCVKY